VQEISHYVHKNVQVALSLQNARVPIAVKVLLQSLFNDPLILLLRRPSIKAHLKVSPSAITVTSIMPDEFRSDAA
jgi:hypothetical protein